jgi:hypothetical protein
VPDRECLPQAAEHDLLVRDEARRPHEWIGGSVPIRAAVAFDVPDGASRFSSEWSSTIAARGNTLAASSANCIISTAPLAKFGAWKHGTPAFRAARSVA